LDEENIGTDDEAGDSQDNDIIRVEILALIGLTVGGIVSAVCHCQYIIVKLPIRNLNIRKECSDSIQVRLLFLLQIIFVSTESILSFLNSKTWLAIW
jgi:hypothetical protein